MRKSPTTSSLLGGAITEPERRSRACRRATTSSKLKGLVT